MVSLAPNPIRSDRIKKQARQQQQAVKDKHRKRECEEEEEEEEEDNNKRTGGFLRRKDCWIWTRRLDGIRREGRKRNIINWVNLSIKGAESFK